MMINLISKYKNIDQIEVADLIKDYSVKTLKEWGLVVEMGLIVSEENVYFYKTITPESLFSLLFLSPTFKLEDLDVCAFAFKFSNYQIKSLTHLLSTTKLHPPGTWVLSNKPIEMEIAHYKAKLLKYQDLNSRLRVKLLSSDSNKHKVKGIFK